MKTETAFFAAGCFWGVEDSFGKLPGVLETEVGYMGGDTPSPTYEKVCTGGTGYAETVKVIFDPKIISYAALLEHFFTMHNPTTLSKQGLDVGTQYRSAIFTTTQEQQTEAFLIVKKLNTEEKFEDLIVTEILDAPGFYKAEEYHQKYSKKNKGFVCHI